MSSYHSPHLRFMKCGMMILLLGVLAPPCIVTANEMTIGFTVSDGTSSSSSSSSVSSSQASSSASPTAEIIGGNSRKATEILESITSDDLPEITTKRMLPSCDVTEKRIPLRYYCDPVTPTVTTPLHQSPNTPSAHWYQSVVRYFLQMNDGDATTMPVRSDETAEHPRASPVLQGIRWQISRHSAANGHLLLLLLLIGLLLIMIALRILKRAHRSFRNNGNHL